MERWFWFERDRRDDLTDTMYDPQDRPFVPHDQGTALVVEYIEKYWCPTTRSENLLKALEP